MVWPFRKRAASRNGDSLQTIDEAIAFVAQRWLAFSGAVPISTEGGLRARIGLFARTIDDSLHRRFPALAAASEEVMLLIIAKGIEQSGAVDRRAIEHELGILLPR